jgi:pimeloyl-ACP methyl ester esterase
MPFIETYTGVKLHYEDRGQGPPLVLLHGWGGSGRLWRFQEELAADFRLVIPDMRGHGRSSAAAVGLTLDDLVDDVVSLCKRLGFEELVLLGWSLGAQVAIASFPRLQGCLSGIVLVGATARFIATEGYPHGLPANELRGMGLRLRRDHERTMGEFSRSMFAKGELSKDQEMHIASEVMTDGRLPDLASALAALNILAETDLRLELSALDLPVLMIHGDSDAICPLAAARFILERLPDARLLEFSGVGHAPPLSHPEEFNASLRDFLVEVFHGRH